MKRGGGYYLHVASQFSNKLTVVDLDPNGDGSATDASGRTRAARQRRAGWAPHDRRRGRPGIKPLPNVYDGWVQDTVARTAQTDAEVRGWIAKMTRCQKNPSASNCAPAGPGR